MEVILPEIYLREGTVLHGEKSHGLIRTALARYLKNQECESLNIGEIDNIVNGVKIEVYKEGKPYFENLDVEFSVSNTGPMWMCLLDRKPCGIDIQEVKSCKHESIAERHFSKEEFEYVKLWGEEGFFDIWTAKEAFGKYTGKNNDGGRRDDNNIFDDFCGGLCVPIGDSHTEYSLCGSSAVGGDY